MKQMFSESLLADLKKQHIVVFGDLMLDRYWYGDVSRISPEAPVPVVKVQDCELRPGGAANVALNVRSLGATVELFGFVGKDQEASQLRSTLEDKGVICHFAAEEGLPTITKLRLMGRNQQLIRMDFEEGFEQADVGPLYESFCESIKNADAVILSDYAKGSLCQAQQFVRAVKKYNKPIFVDPKGSDMTRFSGATLLTPNRKEFDLIAGAYASQEEMEQEARTILEAQSISAMLITLGKDGMLLVEKDKPSFLLPTRALQVFDVTGAGDTVIALFALAYASTQNMKKSVVVSNTAAGIVVGKLGAGTVTVTELRRRLQKQSASDLGILSQSELQQMVNDLRLMGEKIVMTNGCFDILHSGHIHYLEQAKSLGDRLIVAVNDDASVERLKGSPRPYNTLLERMKILAGLRSVDWVVAFSEDTPQRLIGEILPDILVKGGDYRVEEVAGNEEVIANGGEVTMLDFIDGLSTSTLVERIKQNEEIES